jgi:hypothetical protein
VNLELRSKSLVCEASGRIGSRTPDLSYYCDEVLFHLRMTSQFSVAELREVQALPEKNPKSSPERSGNAEISGETSDSMARITVSLPRSLCRKFRLHALDQETTLSALMAKLIRQELKSFE